MCVVTCKIDCMLFLRPPNPFLQLSILFQSYILFLLLPTYTSATMIE